MECPQEQGDLAKATGLTGVFLLPPCGAQLQLSDRVLVLHIAPLGRGRDGPVSNSDYALCLGSHSSEVVSFYAANRTGFTA
jgi:hypothetical protein